MAPIYCFGGKDLAQEMNTLDNFSLREILKNFFEEKSVFWDQQVGWKNLTFFSIDKYLHYVISDMYYKTFLGCY